MSLLNTKMDEFLANPEAVQWERPKWIHGGAGYSGIVAIACASVMNKDQSLIVTSICEKLFQISQSIGKNDSTVHFLFFPLKLINFHLILNRVVTGLRFVKKNRIIHIQIQEGELQARGLVNASTLNWKSMSEYKLLDRGIRNGLDYHTMSWDKRAIDLDDLIAPVNHVVTGVRMRVIGTHLNLEIRVTEADFTTGRLIDPEETSFWKSNDNTESSSNKRTPVKLTKPDIPTLSASPSEIDSTTNQYIEFTHTDLERDVGQTTVPYIDAQDVISRVPVALSGAGVYHKGQSLYGGFIGLKLITYDFQPHITTPNLADAAEDVKIVNLQN